VGLGEADEGPRLQRHRDREGAAPTDVIRRAAHHQPADERGGAHRADQRRGEQGRDAEPARHRHQVHQRDEDRDPGGREHSVEDPERARAERAEDRPVTRRRARARGCPRGPVAVGSEADALRIPPHQDREGVQGQEDRGPEDHVRPPPAEPAHQEVGDRRQHERPEAAARAGQPHREAAPAREPPDHGRMARHVRGGHAERGDGAVEHVGLPEGADPAHRHEARPEQRAADPDDGARSPAIGEPARHQGEARVDRRVEGEDPREARAAPTELVHEGGEEDAERVLGPVGHEQDEKRGRHHRPAVEDTPGSRPGSARPGAGTSGRHRPGA
jgi:hypothetical protein